MRPSICVLAASLSALLAASCVVALAQSTEERSIDPAASKAQFSIQHIFVERVNGTLPIVSGTVTLPGDSVTPVSVSAVLDPGRMNTGDRDRDASLESPDYFDVKKFPTWTFTSTKITATGPAAFGMDGMLTAHGVTQMEHLDVTVRGDASHPMYHAIGHVDRHAFNMKGTRLDPVIGNVADVTLDIVLK
jgi:polyisoprenoid-binding protein YceI